MQLITSWDDGSKHDLRMAELLKKYGFLGIFYIPSNCELVRKEIKQLADMGMEIGGHTISHPMDMKLLSKGEAFAEIKGNRSWLQEITDQAVLSFAYPRGRYNEETIECVKQAGFEDARTTKVFYLSGDDPYQTHTTIHIHPSRPEYKGKSWFALAKEHLLKAREDDIFHLWGHSSEIEKFGMWEELEAFLKFAYENLRAR